jgi:DNA polymerase III subunit epsilon
VKQIVLDTETTGLEPSQGHRIIELACIELANRRLTAHQFHRYLNPDRDSDEAALAIHGLTREFLADKPRFADIADEFIVHVEGAELLIHNAAFDVGFLNAELERAGKPAIETFCKVTDTLSHARELHPGKRNSLDALCERYGVDNSSRTLHGALLDVQLLGEVWIAMTRGQDSLDIAVGAGPRGTDAAQTLGRPARLLVIEPTAEELRRHAEMLERLDKEAKGRCVWKQLQRAAS